MVFTSADPSRPPVVGSPFDAGAQRRGLSLAARAETARPVPGTEEPERSADGAAPETADAFAQFRARPAALPAWGGDRPRGPDGPMVLHHPRGAPSDAVPAASRLDARIAFDPVYVHHQAATRYAFVSAMPTSVADRRRQFEVFA